MTYREFAPPRELANVIECVWTRLPETELVAKPIDAQPHTLPVAHAVLPDGAMDVIATFFDDGEVNEAFVVGSMTQPQVATLDRHPLVGVRFLPGIGGSALGTNAVTLTDEQADIRDVFKQSDLIRAAFRSLRLDSGSAHALHLFAQGLGMHKREVPSLVRLAAKRLAQQSSGVRVEQVAKDLHVSRQHLARVFSAHAGLTPKLFAQICRVRALLSAAQSQLLKFNDAVPAARLRSAYDANEPRRAIADTWSTLAAEFGYVDQSHLIAEVHAIIGQTPAAWQAAAGSNIPIVPVPVGPL